MTENPRQIKYLNGLLSLFMESRNLNITGQTLNNKFL